MTSKQESTTERKLPPNAGKGRRKGAVNKTTAVLKDAILKAAEAIGEDGKGRLGLEGYLRRVAVEDVKAFSGLLGKVLPLQVTGEGGGPVQMQATVDVTGLSVDQLRALASIPLHGE
jgi:hypothetical protein